MKLLILTKRSLVSIGFCMIIGVLAGLIGYLVATKWLPILSEKITGRKRT